MIPLVRSLVRGLFPRLGVAGVSLALVSFVACRDPEGGPRVGAAGTAGRGDGGIGGGGGSGAGGIGGASSDDESAGGAGGSALGGASGAGAGGVFGVAGGGVGGGVGDGGTSAGGAGGAGTAGASVAGGSAGGAGAPAGAGGATGGGTCAFDEAGYCSGAPKGEWCCGVSGTLFDVEASCWLGEIADTPDIGPVASQSIACGNGLCVAQLAPGCYRLTRGGRDVRIWSNSFIITLPPSVIGATDLRKCTEEERQARAADVARPPCP